MKYIIDVPEEIAEISEEFLSKAGLLCEPYTEPDRKAIEDEVWEFVNDAFWSMTQEDIDECYDGWFPKSYQEAKAKYEAWKKQKDKIHVGDEVVYHGNKYVVGYVGADEVYHIVDRNWIRVVVQGDYQIFKTGRHFDGVAELLEKMRGDSDGTET